jgi:hypothetical protein
MAQRPKRTHYLMTKPAGWRPGDVTYALCTPEISVTGGYGIKLTRDVSEVTCKWCQDKLVEMNRDNEQTFKWTRHVGIESWPMWIPGEPKP